MVQYGTRPGSGGLRYQVRPERRSRTVQEPRWYRLQETLRARGQFSHARSEVSARLAQYQHSIGRTRSPPAGARHAPRRRGRVATGARQWAWAIGMSISCGGYLLAANGAASAYPGCASAGVRREPCALQSCRSRRPPACRFPERSSRHSRRSSRSSCAAPGAGRPWP